MEGEVKISLLPCLEQPVGSQAEPDRVGSWANATLMAGG